MSLDRTRAGEQQQFTRVAGIRVDKVKRRGGRADDRGIWWKSDEIAVSGRQRDRGDRRVSAQIPKSLAVERRAVDETVEVARMHLQHHRQTGG